MMINLFSCFRKADPVFRAVLISFILAFIIDLFLSTSLLTTYIRLLTGWLSFIISNSSRIEINFSFVFEALVSFIALFGIIQFTTKKITSYWKWQWTLAIIACPLLLFIIAIASIGLVESYRYFFLIK